MTKPSRRPDIFIVGVKKGGTSALHSWLAQHPKVLMPEVKEPNFFAPDLHFSSGNRPAKSVEEYLRLFGADNGEHRFGEASTSYLLSEVAAELISSFNPEARIIVILRDPVDVVCSLHSYLVYLGVEPLERLSDALAAEADRRCGRLIARRSASMPHWLNYRAVVDYAPQLRRYFDVFDRDRVHLIRHEALVCEPEAVLSGLLRFLDLTPECDLELSRVNSNRRVRSALVRNVIADPRSPGHRAVKMLVPARARQSVLRLASRMNTRVSARPAPEPELAGQLRRELLGGIEDLERLVQWDLSAWKTTTGRLTDPSG